MSEALGNNGGAKQSATPPSQLPPSQLPPSQPPPRPLDDVMIAMDVVDTLRQDARIVDRELNDETRRAELIERLRDIYHGQGIEVPDAILEDGVKALEEKRFVYDPPAPGLATRLAQIYVTRDRWGRAMLAAAAGIAALWGAWYLTVERPRQVAVAATERELRIELPGVLSSLGAQVTGEAKADAVRAEATGLLETGLAAAAGGRRDEAKAAAERLSAILAELRQRYDVRIVARQGEVSGLWRVPKVNASQRNYYLVVEAVGPDGRTLERTVRNEETGSRDQVTKWAQRVPKATFDAIQADKLDDGIIQQAVIGSKVLGEADPRWLMDVADGALTDW